VLKVPLKFKLTIHHEILWLGSLASQNGNCMLVVLTDWGLTVWFDESINTTLNFCASNDMFIIFSFDLVYLRVRSCELVSFIISIMCLCACLCMCVNVHFCGWYRLLLNRFQGLWICLLVRCVASIIVHICCCGGILVVKHYYVDHSKCLSAGLQNNVPVAHSDMAN